MNRLLEPLLDRGRNLLKRLSPKLVLRIQRARGLGFEPEMRLLPLLSSKAKLSIDVGANAGLFLYELRRHARACVAFEPNPDLAVRLRRSFGHEVRIEQAALSDAPGSAVLRIPMLHGRRMAGLGSIKLQQTAQNEPLQEFEVAVKTLDDYGFRDVGFVKIDVEGAEAAVLRGAEQLIRRERPNLYIEAENRHAENAVADITKFLEKLGYAGFFVDGTRLRPVPEFDPAKDQIYGNTRYINNFIFLSDVGLLDQLAQRLRQ